AAALPSYSVLALGLNLPLPAPGCDSGAGAFALCSRHTPHSEPWQREVSGKFGGSSGTADGQSEGLAGQAHGSPRSSGNPAGIPVRIGSTGVYDAPRAYPYRGARGCVFSGGQRLARTGPSSGSVQ